MTYGTERVQEIVDWYLGVLGTYPVGPDREARSTIVSAYCAHAMRAAEDPSPAAEAAAAAWSRAVLILAEAARAEGHPGWQARWDGVYETAG
ncbi:hypothetical protein ACH4E8_29360 [Streptomyces sp. NPDC017979]|uniref:hypothetical protein n=1 Tax=Streptomyces sp. NPDC017979 TaxID=3365024 RepID=UPI003787B901